ncbi:MAG: tetratricopeptide repeat protein, partial [Desulfobulbaceae bacterium]|nr:tetratricopeptide repeat protein [Desulfobulbaceae bacterium]
TTLDFQDLNFEKIAPCMGRDWPFALVSNIKGTPITPKRFPARHLFLTFPEDKPHMWMAKSLGINQFLPPMSSVANLSLGLAIHLGADPIFFVGQDLAFTSRKNDHAEGTVFHSDDPGSTMETQFVEGIDGNKVETARDFMTLQKQFEDVISSFPRNYWNCSAAGVRLKGAPSIELAEAAKMFMRETVPVSEFVDEAIKNGKDFAVQPFLKESVKVLRKISMFQKQLKTALALWEKIDSFLAGPAQQSAPAQSFDEFPEKIKQKLRRFDKINCLMDKDLPFWDQVLELTFEKLKNNDRVARENERIREEEGYHPWLMAELVRIEAVNKARLDALQLYGNELGAVVNHLVKEKKLRASARSKTKVDSRLALARLYNESGDLNLAVNVLADCDAGAGDERIDLLKGEVSAGLLDLEDAWRYWQRAAGRGGEISSRIAGAARRAMVPWLDGIEKLGKDHGNNPALLTTLFVRIDKLLLPDAPLPARIESVWQENKKEIAGLLDEQKNDKAMKAISPWLIFSSRLPEISFLHARLLYAGNELPGAMRQLAAALDKKPEEAGWLALLARVELESGHFDSGVVRLQQAVAIDPRYATLWEELGDVLMQQADHEHAVIAYERCFVALPDYLIALVKMGDSYLHNCKPEAARAAYEAVLAKDPGNEEARHRLTLT